MARIFIYGIIFLLSTIFFTSIEEIALKTGMPWTLSKALPYLLLILTGILTSIWFARYLHIKNNGVKAALLLIVLVLPFGTGFILHPIYEGDFSKNGQALNPGSSLEDFKNTDLAVIAIPGCPYCHGSIDDLKKLKERNPSLRVKFIVLSSDPEDLTPYHIQTGDTIEVVNSSQLDSLGKIASYSFPSFVQIRNNKAILKWSNDQFGVRAKDLLEAAYRKQS